MQDDIVIVVAGGGVPPVTPSLPAARVVVAADGGVDLALALGLHVDLVVGDLDSATPAGLAAAEAAGARVVRHPPEKDATDLELALDEAAMLGPRRIVVLGGEGGRLDHLLSGLLVLAAKRYSAVEVEAFLGAARACVVRGERQFQGEVGELISLIPLLGAAEGVVTEGLRYPLRRETLPAGSSRGVSNQFEAAGARVSLERGVLLAVRPGAPL